MIHFAFIAPPYLGHLNPMSALAGELVGRGHRVTFVAQADAAAFVSADFGFHAVGAASHPPGTLARMTAHIAGLNGLLGLGKVIGDVARTTDMYCSEGPRALTDLGVRAIVSDQLEAAGGLLAERLGLPCVSVANALMIDREPDVPPPFTPWRHAESDWARERNRGGYRVSDWLMRPVEEIISRWCGEWSLRPRRRIDECLAPVQIGQLVRGLDMPRKALPEGFNYVGPLRRAASAAMPDLPLDRTRPFVFASLGTLQGARFAIFRRIAAACRDLGLQLVIAHGGRLSPAQAAALPATIVAAYLPQQALIKDAALVVTHGGLNTVLDALGAGVPLVLIPLAMEQAAIAARVERAGAGEVLSRYWLTASGLRRAIARVLAQQRYRTRAIELAEQITSAGGCRRGADVVEAVLAQSAGAGRGGSHAA